MPTLTQIKRQWKVCAFIDVPALLLFAAVFTGFGGDLATAALVRISVGSVSLGYGSGPLYYGPDLA